MRVWRTNNQILGQGAGAPTGWVAADFLDSQASPGTHLLKNDDGTIFGIDPATGQGHNFPAGTDDAHTQCYLPESRAQIAYGAGVVFGILLFP
jgi:hypothetical protein